VFFKLVSAPLLKLKKEGALEMHNNNKKWYTKRLVEEFRNSSYEGVFSAPFICQAVAKNPIWNPVHKNCYFFVNAVNCWINLSKEVENNFLKKCLLLQIDLYLPRILEIENSGTFSSFGLNTSVYWKMLEDKLLPLIISEVLPPSKNNNSKNHILHLLSKAQPLRCQIRNLQQIILNYCNESNETYSFIMMILHRSLFGLYECAEEKLCFEGRVTIYKSFVTQLSSKSFFTRWFRSNQSNSCSHQIYIFYALKEFLINAVKQCAPVYDVLDKKYSWSKFHNQVVTFMDSTRKKLNLIAVREYNFLERSDWLASIETILSSAAKQHIKLFRTTVVLGYYQKLKNDICKFFYSKDKFCVDKYLNKRVKEFLWRFTQRSGSTSLFNVLPCCGIDVSLVEALKNKTFSNKDFHKVDERSLEFIVEICRLEELKKNITFYTLPQHIYEEQKKTLALKERMDVADENKAGPYNPHPTAALNFVCFVCSDVKIFIMSQNRKNNRHSNRLSRGSLRIVVNNNNDNLQLCCGKRAERHTKNGKRKFRHTQDAKNRKLKKEKIRDALADRCVDTPCQQLDLLGNALSYNNKLYIICCLCGNACILHKDAYNHSILPNCQTCYKQHYKNVCVKCNSNQHTIDIMCLDKQTGYFMTAPFCNNCAAYHTKQPILL